MAQQKNGNNDRKTLFELNLCEFPISALTIQRNFKPLSFEDSFTDPATGNRVNRSWTVDGSLIFGTPVATDKDVLHAVINLMKNDGCFE